MIQLRCLSVTEIPALNLIPVHSLNQAHSLVEVLFPIRVQIPFLVQFQVSARKLVSPQIHLRREIRESYLGPRLLPLR